MDAFLQSLSAVALIFLMISVGFISGKAGLMKSAHKPFLVKYLINIAVPAMCIANVFEQFNQVNVENPVLLFVPPALSMLATLAMALVLGKLFKIEKKRFGAFVVMCAFSNSMFVGLPMCRELFGEVGVPYVIFFYIVNTLMFWTVGVALIQRSGDSGEKMTPLKVLKRLMTPPLISLIAAMALMLLGVELPHLVVTFCGYFGDTVSPLALMYVGFVIYETGIKKSAFSWSFVTAMLMRFVAAPAISILICSLFKMPTLAVSVFTAESAMPVMTQSVIMSAAAGADEEYAASAMTISTALCLAFIPALMAVMQGLGLLS